MYMDYSPFIIVNVNDQFAVRGVLAFNIVFLAYCCKSYTI